MGIPIDHRRVVTDVLGRKRMIGSVEWRRSGSTVGSADISATIKGFGFSFGIKKGRLFSRPHSLCLCLTGSFPPIRLSHLIASIRKPPRVLLSSPSSIAAACRSWPRCARRASAACRWGCWCEGLAIAGDCYIVCLCLLCHCCGCHPDQHCNRHN